jgi:hypothetical protein
MKTVNWSVILQMLLVAGLSTLASGYVSGRIVESKMEYVIQEIRRIDTDAKETRLKLEEVQLRQARAISQAESIHGAQDQRLGRLESRR